MPTALGTELWLEIKVGEDLEVTSFEVLKPTSSIHEFIEPLVVGKIKYALVSSNSKHMQILRIAVLS